MRCHIRSFLAKQPSKEEPIAAMVDTDKQNQAKKAKIDGNRVAGLPSLRSLCWNVMGLTTVQDELIRIVDEHKPDVITLTETKLQRTGRNEQKLAEELTEYQLYTSCKPDPDGRRPGERWATGVAIAVHKRLTRHASATHQLLNGPAASGHCQRIILQPAGSDALELWAVYMPHDMALRKQVYQVLRDNMPKTDHKIVAGDWSAAYRAADRASGQLSSADRSHQQLLADLHLSSIDADGNNSRDHTFYSKADAG